VLAAERHSRISDAIELDRVVSTEFLSAALGVSIETVRRDLIELETQGVLRRVRGGAARTPVTGGEGTFEHRSTLASEAKTAIGSIAASLIGPRDTVVMDVGTTALAVARALPDSFQGTVATCSMPVAVELAARGGIDVLLSGGRVRSGDLALSNAQAVSFFADIHADVAFVGSGGVDLDAGLTDFYLDEISTRRTIIRNATKSYVLADIDKLGRIAPYRVCSLNDITAVITNPARSSTRAYLVDAGIPLIDVAS
jgi:DeoR family transcriptional regulator, fructose operon transcriptional repressor